MMGIELQASDRACLNDRLLERPLDRILEAFNFRNALYDPRDELEVFFVEASNLKLCHCSASLHRIVRPRPSCARILMTTPASRMNPAILNVEACFSLAARMASRRSR